MNTMTTKKGAKKAKRPWWVFAVVGVVAAALLGVLVFSIGHTPGKKPPAAGGGIGSPVPAGVLQNLTSIPQSTWAKVTPPSQLAPQVVASTSTPTFLYVGAEGCPYCAAERWAMVVALSRFGRFSHLTMMRSASNDSVSPDTPTFSFYGATYKSPYLHADLMEVYGDKLGNQGFYPPLQKLSSAQQALWEKYDAPPYIASQNAGSIPFVLVGGRYLWIGSAVPPTLLTGGAWTTLSQEVHGGTRGPGPDVLASANALTAAICASDGSQPTSVCSVPVIQQTLKSWPKS